MSPADLFTSLYCGVLAATLCLKHPDQYRYLLFAGASEPTALLVNRFPIPRLSARQFHLVAASFVICLVLASLHCVQTAALSVATGLYFLYFGQIRGLSYIHRKTNLIPQVLIVLALRPLVDQLSGISAPYWSLEVVEALVVEIYLVSAFCKLRTSGFAWTRPAQMRGILLFHHLCYELPLSAALAGNAAVCGFLGLGGLLFELTFWTVLVLPGAAVPYALAGLGLHLCTLVLMRIDYITYHATIFVVFFIPSIIRLLSPHAA